MSSVQQILNALSPEEVEILLNNPAVLEAQQRLDSGSTAQVYLSVTVPESIKESLKAKMGLDLGSAMTVPMRWIRGNIAPHFDVGASAFENTYLVYLTDSEGSLQLEGNSYPIKKGAAYVFQEGLTHSTVDTGSSPRLLLGPMNEFAQPVGLSPIYYFSNYTDAYGCLR
jgi:hypothetical protein